MDKKEFYAAKNKEDKERILSSSGGVFLVLAKSIIQKKGIVYGAIYDNDFNVSHIRGDSIELVKKMTGSKYTQSNLKNVFKYIKSDLDSGKDVLFCGTPCQVSAIKMFTKDNNSNLITIDLVCHGTPEKKFFRDYIKYEEEMNKSQIINIDMRYKDKKRYKKNIYRKPIKVGIIEPHFMKLDFANNKRKIERSDFNSYYLLFDYFIKKECFNCHFSNLERKSDITIGDFHEFKSSLGEFNDGNGVSLMIVNTEKGKKIIEEEKNNFILLEKEEEECLQPPLIRATAKPFRYERFQKDYKEYGYKYVVKKYVKSGIKYKIRKILYKLKILDILMILKNKLRKKCRNEAK